ncbi:16973_t:CDS:1, partial [Cetraspora pellucida]
MPRQKLTGSCAIKNCNSQVNSFRNITQDLIDKIEKCSDFSYDYLKVNEDQICYEHYMNIINFIISQSFNNEKSITWIDLEDLIEISKISLNNSNIPIDYLQNYKRNNFIDLDLNNFSNIKIKIVENNIIFSKKNFNKLIDIIINQTIQI